MCVLCDNAAAQRLGLNGEMSISAGLPLPTDSVSAQSNNASAQDSQQLVAADGVMDMYLHAPGGAIEVSGGGEYNQTLGLPSVVIPAIRSKITNKPTIDNNQSDASINGLYPTILNQIPTQGNNPWVDGVSYDGKLFNPYTNFYTSINFNKTKKALFELNGYQPLDDEKPVNILISFVSNKELPGSINLAENTKDLQDPGSTGLLVTPWPEKLRVGYLEAYKTIQDVANINIVEKGEEDNVNIQYFLADTTNSIRRPKNGSTTLGSHDGILTAPAGLPQTSWINASSFNETTQITPGSSFLETAIHEIGHGLGLSHPHDRGLDSNNPSPVFPGLNPTFGGGDSFGTFGYGVNSLNQNVYTIMSYNSGLRYGSSGEPLTTPNDYEGHSSTPMALDIMALQIKYGYNISTALDDNIYILPTSPSGLSNWSSIWDCGGTDIIDASSALGDVVIELRAAPMNAYRPQSKEMSESYNWKEMVNNEDDSFALQTIIDVINPTGALLGTTFSFAISSSVVVNRFKELTGVSFSDHFNNAFSKAKEAGTQLNVNWATAVIEGLANDLRSDMSSLQSIDPEFAKLREDAYNYQNLTLNESAANVGGYISQQLGNQGGFTIAAGTEIENAVGSNFNDTINGNHINNILYGLDGNDQLDGRQGNDIIFAQAGNDLIDGGVGDDSLLGGAGSNTFINNRDGYSDTLYIQSNQDLAANNNAATDVIYSLDSIDRIVITDPGAQSLRIEAASFDNQFGIGIFTGTTLDAIYFGTNLSVEDIQSITTIA